MNDVVKKFDKPVFPHAVVGHTKTVLELTINGYKLETAEVVSEWEGFYKVQTTAGVLICADLTKTDDVTEFMSKMCNLIYGESGASRLQPGMKLAILKASPALIDLLEEINER